MRLSLPFIALGLVLSPMVAAAEPISWSRYQVPETGAAVDFPSRLESRKQDTGGAFSRRTGAPT
jgi:hypothetical protein